jgi:hypothetical protein
MKISQLSRILRHASVMHASSDVELAKALGELAEILKNSADSEAADFVERVCKLRSASKSKEGS